MLIQAISNCIYMRNNAALSYMNANNARIGMLSFMGAGMTQDSLSYLSSMDTQLELQAITSSLQYKMAQAELEQLKKLQKEKAKQFSVFG